VERLILRSSDSSSIARNEASPRPKKVISSRLVPIIVAIPLAEPRAIASSGGSGSVTPSTTGMSG
jgi:hypothetical protein